MLIFQSEQFRVIVHDDGTFTPQERYASGHWKLFYHHGHPVARMTNLRYALELAHIYAESVTVERQIEKILSSVQVQEYL